jgi:hypothetical protein
MWVGCWHSQMASFANRQILQLICVLLVHQSVQYVSATFLIKPSNRPLVHEAALDYEQDQLSISRDGESGILIPEKNARSHSRYLWNFCRHLVQMDRTIYTWLWT